MAFAAEPLAALVDPIDGVARAVQARRWVLPLVMLAACTCASGVAFALRWNAAPTVVAQIETAGEMNTTTEQELEEKVLTTERIALVGAVAKGLVLMPLAVVLVSAFLKFLSWLLGTPAPFVRCLSAAAVAFLPIALYHLLYAAVAWRAPGISLAQAATLVPSSLAAVVHSAGPRLSRALPAVDFFNVWAAVLLGLGFAAAANLRRSRGVVLGIVLYGAYAAVFLVALPGLSGGGGTK